MAFIAEFGMKIPPLAQASAAVPEIQVSGEDIVLFDDQAHKFVFTAHGSQFDEFEDALRADPTVEEFEVLTKLAETAYYVVTYDSDVDTGGLYHLAVEENVVYLNVELRDGEYTVRARVPDRAALATLRGYCDENDIPFHLDRIYRESESGSRGQLLTDSQREAIRLAYERGYFNSPRETSLDAIADELGISRQAVADRLRRGHKNLIEATVV